MLFRRVRNGDTRLRSVGAMPKTQEAVVGRRWRQGCIDGLASDCWLVRRISEVNFSAYGLALLTEAGQCTVVSVSDLGYYPCHSCPLPHATYERSTSLPLTMQISQRQIDRDVARLPLRVLLKATFSGQGGVSRSSGFSLRVVVAAPVWVMRVFLRVP